MKKIVLIVVLAINFLSCAPKKSVIKYDAPKKEIKDVITTGSKEQNFVKANEWFVIMFVNSKNVNRYSDKEAGLIKGKFTLFSEKTWVPASKNSYAVKSGIIDAVITIRVKEDKARLEIEVMEPFYTTKYGNIEYGHTPDEVNAEINKLVSSFVSYMIKGPENEW